MMISVGDFDHSVFCFDDRPGIDKDIVTGGSNPPPPPVPPPQRPTALNLSTRRMGLSGGNAGRVGSPRRQTGQAVVLTWSSPSLSRPSSPRSYAIGESYNSVDEQRPCFMSSYDDIVRLLRGDSFVYPKSVYKTVEELWDGEI